jgi:hypothetical protein
MSSPTPRPGAAGIAVTVLARAPEPGRVKTRLSRDIGAAAACDVHVALALDTIASVHAWLGDPRRLVVSTTGAEAACARFEAEVAATLGCRHERQSEGTLGDRIAAALALRLAEGARAALVVGTDCPLLHAALLDACVVALQAADVVLVPATDGGFVLIGARRPATGCLTGVPWGGPHVLEATERSVASGGLSVERVGEAEDVDDLDTLRRLARHLASHPEEAPRTAAWLRQHDVAS